MKCCLRKTFCGLGMFPECLWRVWAVKTPTTGKIERVTAPVRPKAHPLSSVTPVSIRVLFACLQDGESWLRGRKNISMQILRSFCYLILHKSSDS